MSPAGEPRRPIRVLVVDDCPDVRHGLKAILGPHRDVEVVGEAGHGLEAVAVAAELRPNVVLMDVQMPRMDGIEATQLIKRRMPETKVLFLTLILDDFLLKYADREELLRAIRNLAPAA